VHFVGLFLSSLLKMHGPKKKQWMSKIMKPLHPKRQKLFKVTGLRKIREYGSYFLKLKQHNGGYLISTFSRRQGGDIQRNTETRNGKFGLRDVQNHTSKLYLKYYL